jgi:hypothetical protein
VEYQRARTRLPNPTNVRRYVAMSIEFCKCKDLILLIIIFSPLQDIGLSNFSPSRSIFGYSYPVPASYPAQTVTPPGLKASYTTFTETRFALQNLFTPAVIGSTGDMASPLPLQHANTVCYAGDLSSLPISDHLVSDGTAEKPRA